LNFDDFNDQYTFFDGSNRFVSNYTCPEKISEPHMIEFTLYGIENEMFHKLHDRLVETMKHIPVSYRIRKVDDIDQIVEAEIFSVPSLYLKDKLLAENSIPEEPALRDEILQLVKVDKSNRNNNNHK
jgi:hypothetical protein